MCPPCVKLVMTGTACASKVCTGNKDSTQLITNDTALDSCGKVLTQLTPILPHARQIVYGLYTDKAGLLRLCNAEFTMSYMSQGSCLVLRMDISSLFALGLIGLVC